MAERGLRQSIAESAFGVRCGKTGMHVIVEYPANRFSGLGRISSLKVQMPCSREVPFPCQIPAR
jgi:hypothetical protein